MVPSGWNHRHLICCCNLLHWLNHCRACKCKNSFNVRKLGRGRMRKAGRPGFKVHVNHRYHVGLLNWLSSRESHCWIGWVHECFTTCLISRPYNSTTVPDSSQSILKVRTPFWYLWSIHSHSIDHPSTFNLSSLKPGFTHFFFTFLLPCHVLSSTQT